MRILGGSVLVLAVAAFGGAAARPEPPNILLHIPFDGTPEPAFAANGRKRASYIHVAYRPGVRAQGAEFGSDRHPCGLVVPATGLLDKAAGSVEFWYMPLWNPADPTQQKPLRALICDEKPWAAIGHISVRIERAALLFSLQGQQQVRISAPIHRWKPETWHHIVATWDGQAGMRLFVDGERAGELDATWVLPPSETLYIGADRFGGNRADGLFDELRLYDRALTPTEAELAFIHNLVAKNAPLRALPEPAAPRAAPQAARLSFHATFDNIADAQTAAGEARALVADGARYAPGLLGQALVAKEGLNLAYAFEKNLSKEQGAVSLWTCALPEAARPWRGVLVSDDLFAAGPQRESPGAFSLWLERNGASRGLFALWPIRFEEPLPRWEAREWFHLAASWRRGQRITYWVNGREVGRVNDSYAAWSVEEARRIYVGGLDGRLAPNALIDDLRFYDAPLTHHEVQKLASQFVLPLVFQLGRTLYERGQPADVPVRFFNLLPEEFAYKITVRVANPEGKEVHRVDIPLEVPGHSWSQVRMPLAPEAVASEGLYQVTTSAEGRTSNPRTYFIVVAPEAKVQASQGAEPALKLDHVLTMECARQTTRDTFCESGGARVVESGLGAYHEAAPQVDARLAYRFRVAMTGVPHVAMLSIPADRARAAEVVMTSRRFPSARDVATGFFVTQREAATPALVELPIWFWPREEENSISLRTLLPGQPAACTRIDIRRAPDRLPPAAVEPPADGGRTLGLHWELPAVPMQFGSATQQPPEVYESFRRLADYMRFAGLNVLYYPVVWHAGLLYPAEAEGFRLGAGADLHANDWIEYVLYLCERHGIRFVPDIIFDNTVALSNSFSGATSESVIAGGKTARMVTWDDTLTRGEMGGPPRYNPLHPAVRAALLDRVTELVDRYGKSPALAGVSIRLGPGQSTWFGSIQCGYDDETVAEFAREGGFELAEGKSGPTRFSERARWILANRYDQWVAFRCRRLRAVYSDLASRLQSKRQDLVLYLTVGVPDSSSEQPLLNLGSWSNRPGALDAIWREAGLDVSLYKDRPTNLVLRKVTHATDEQGVAYRIGSAPRNPWPALARDLAFLAEGSGPLVGFPRVAAACTYRYFESAISAVQPLPGHWWPEPLLRASQPTPLGRRFLEPYALAVADLDVQSLTLGGGSLAGAGREDLIREFARAFRALPAAQFSPLMKMSDPVCARELALRDGHIFYLVNRASFPVDAYVAFSARGVRLKDFVAGQEIDLPHAERKEVPAMLPKDFVSEHLLTDEEGPLPGKPDATETVTGSLLQVRLEPFQLRSYRVLTSGALIQHASARPPAAARARLAQRLESAKSLVAFSNAEAELIAAARATLDLASRAWRKHELARVEALLDSFPLARLR